MNGAQALIRTLVDARVDVCFSNPGTSEMHFVAALDQVPEMRGVLCLFEGVATGAADGYGRMTGRPASVLLHLGPGLANGLANLHNARRARTPIVTVVGDHAGYHKAYDSPLESDIDALAGTVSGWVRRSARSADIGDDAAAAVAAARTAPGQIATLVLPADTSWSAGAASAAPLPVEAPAAVPDDALAAVAAVLASGEPCALLVGGGATRTRGLVAASRVAAAAGAPLFCETFPARLERGAGRPVVERLPRAADQVTRRLAGVRHLVLVGVRSPVSFFAYPDQPSDLVPDGCQVHELGTVADDLPGALERLADLVGAPAEAVLQPAGRPELPTGELSLDSIGRILGALLPEGAIVVDEGVTSTRQMPGPTAGAPPHDWLTLTGGAIGQGLPVATGAAVAAPGRPVICLEGDGSAMYTVSALWTQAREGLDVTTLVFSNRSYRILEGELANVGAAASGPRARDLLELGRPELDFAAMATGMGVPATRARTAEDLIQQFRRALAEPGPHLIDVVLPGP
ncbi:acetolactate synthase large subunit [Blastococcus saxobsidens]|uniref:Putative acetolactate synthase large subunit (Acetohydroxyacid synthase) (IlvX-like) n=1 Tax=Blastococcus saxobsidens (strain DD2) TaxID=1146883 RepID=H6RN49_BLASD|nr:acetolactate synthase large subunit [Blastococcus saxobsidens]CCG01402.1 putative acetolactate synthase large subunit (acetohydroxyacid synthase) (IlvX-like) [Blastococcus saxobsidens DD2]